MTLSAESLVAMGNELLLRGEIGKAIECYQHALALRPGSAEIHNNLGAALRALGNVAAAIEHYRRAIALAPLAAKAYSNLGNALQQMEKLDEAAACHEKAIALSPDSAEAINNLGKVLDDQGLLDRAIACYRRAVELNPSSPRIHSNLLYALHFHPDSTGESLYQEHRRWNDAHARTIAQNAAPHANVPDPDRPLRIGYVSPDFRLHPVGRFMLPLLKAHDPTAVTTLCYASQVGGDEITAELRKRAAVWRDVFDLSDEQLARQIRDDGIDILVDLTLHMAGNRMLLFARKPAPVQVTYLAYCSTSGLKAIDYRLTTEVLDAVKSKEQWYSEQSIPLRGGYWCYEPGLPTPGVSPPPMVGKGVVTFGCLNNFCKVSEKTLEAWARVLHSVEDSRLMIYVPRGSARQRVAAFMEKKGIDARRLEMVDFTPLSEYFARYGDIDVALDPFPYAGGTTTCDALWMGVPVVTLAGETAVSRSGMELLTRIGLTELVATNVEQYVSIACRLARDASRLEEVRKSLRERMRSSPLMDTRGFARSAEQAFREIWRRWCQGKMAL